MTTFYIKEKDVQAVEAALKEIQRINTEDYAQSTDSECSVLGCDIHPSEDYVAESCDSEDDYFPFIISVNENGWGFYMGRGVLNVFPQKVTIEAGHFHALNMREVQITGISRAYMESLLKGVTLTPGLQLGLSMDEDVLFAVIDTLEK